MTTLSQPVLTSASLRDFAVAWYGALDRHDELDSVLTMLVPDGLEMRFPETTARGYAGFSEWYDAVTTRFFDEVHTVRRVDVVSLEGSTAEVKVLVNWQARVHEGREAKSRWLGFDAYQTWIVIAGPAGPQIKTYIVDRLEPMPGSASL
jgi:hypothetical protein